MWVHIVKNPRWHYSKALLLFLLQFKLSGCKENDTTTESSDRGPALSALSGLCLTGRGPLLPAPSVTQEDNLRSFPTVKAMQKTSPISGANINPQITGIPLEPDHTQA